MHLAIQSGLDIRKQAMELGVSVWKTPTMMTILLGVLILVVMVSISFLWFFNDTAVFLAVETLVIMTMLTIGGIVIFALEEVAKANKWKADFIAIASHQMKSPLAQIKWSLELLKKKHVLAQHSEYTEFLENVGRANADLLRLASELLDVARVDRGEIIVKLGKVEVLDIVRSIKENYVLGLAQKSLKIDIQSEEESYAAYGDAKKILVAIDNLVSNAIKYSNEHGIIEVSVSYADQNNVQICVKDSGMGIPDQQQEQVFGKMFRAYNARSSGVEGTGLGLYLTKHVVEQMNGSIRFHSIEGVGSSFCIQIPKYNKFV